MLSIARSILRVKAVDGSAARAISTSSLRLLQFTNHENDTNKGLRETIPDNQGQETVDVDLTGGTFAGGETASASALPGAPATKAAAEASSFVSHATDPEQSVFPEVVQKMMPQKIERWIPDALHPTEGGGMKYRR